MRLAEIDSKLKFAKQRKKQFVSDLITYVKELKTQLSKSSNKYQKYSHLLHFLHPHLRKTVLRKSSEILPRRELEKLIRRFEHMKDVISDEGGNSRGASSGRARCSRFPYRQLNANGGVQGAVSRGGVVVVGAVAIGAETPKLFKVWKARYLYE